MTRRDYVTLANAVTKMDLSDSARNEVIYHMCNALRIDNARFVAETFIRACGVDPAAFVRWVAKN